uniref:Uncharacterized protein n=1 Tax=Pyricularia oryzae (strain P131) TaxID=1143193 RepID=L7JMQ9_PYRO1
MRRQTLQTGSKGYAIVNASSRAATGHGRDSAKETWNQQAKDELMYFFDNFPKGESNGWEKTPKVRTSFAFTLVLTS